MTTNIETLLEALGPCLSSQVVERLIAWLTSPSFGGVMEADDMPLLRLPGDLRRSMLVQMNGRAEVQRYKGLA